MKVTPCEEVWVLWVGWFGYLSSLSCVVSQGMGYRVRVSLESSCKSRLPFDWKAPRVFPFAVTPALPSDDELSSSMSDGSHTTPAFPPDGSTSSLPPEEAASSASVLASASAAARAFSSASCRMRSASAAMAKANVR